MLNQEVSILGLGLVLVVIPPDEVTDFGSTSNIYLFLIGETFYHSAISFLFLSIRSPFVSQILSLCDAGVFALSF